MIFLRIKGCQSQRSGFSLVELLVVLGIAAILLSVAALVFDRMYSKSRAESQIRQLATDISDLRIKAMTTKQPHGIILNANSYVLSAYTSTTGTYSSPAQQTAIPGGTRTVSFPLTTSAGTVFSNEMYEIDGRGTLTRKLKDGTLTTGSLGVSIFLGGNGSQGSIDCLTIHVMRTNVGKNTAGVCNAR